MARRPADDAVAEPRRRKRRSWARRRHLGLITTGIALVVLVAGVLIVMATWDSGRPSFAQQVAAAASDAGSPVVTTGTPTDTTPATGGPGTSTSSPSPGTSGTGTAGAGVRGVITAIGENQWTVKSNNGLNYTVIVTADTSYVRKRSFDAYAIGDGLVVKGTLDKGTVTATTVTPIKPS